VRLSLSPGRSAERPQRGFALIAVLALAALISAFLIASVLNRSSTDVSNEREQRTMEALRQAKAALIAYAANEQWQKYKSQGTDQPGALPCPDILHNGTESDEGDPDCVGPGIFNTTNLIGRIPWKALGTEDLRDASGERIWYALAKNFRKLSGTTIINSDTQACDSPACNPGESQLTVTGMAPAKNVVAIVFAPGPALDLRQFGGPLQTRPASHTDPAYNNPINYLENFSLGDGSHYTFTTNTSVDTFNDRLLVITQAELMAAVEPVVAARIQRDIGPLVQAYFNKWGAYPFAMSFAVPPDLKTDYKGASNQNQGLLPVTDDANWFKWANATVTQIPPPGLGPNGGNPTVTSWNCSINSSPLRAVCQINYSGGGDDRPDIKLQIFLQNANTAFADIPSPFTAPENFTIAKNGGGLVTNQGSPYGQWSSIGSVVPTMTFATQTAIVSQTGVLTYIARLQNADAMNGGATITIPLPTPQYLPITSSDPALNSSWFISNQWYRQVYYAVSPGYVSGGVPVGNPATCGAPPDPSCLTVNNLPPATNDKRAILVLAGRALNGSGRPSGLLSDYLESANLTGAATLVYEHRSGAPTTINDRVVVISP
jgi:hypothetical protein